MACLHGEGHPGALITERLVSKRDRALASNASSEARIHTTADNAGMRMWRLLPSVFVYVAILKACRQRIGSAGCRGLVWSPTNNPGCTSRRSCRSSSSLYESSAAIRAAIGFDSATALNGSPDPSGHRALARCDAAVVPGSWGGSVRSVRGRGRRYRTAVVVQVAEVVSQSNGA
jgi:hypothetical protein